MAYDPQANRRRPKPDTEETAPVDALLGDPTRPAAATSADPGPTPTTPDDPPPIPSVTPEPADPPPDALLINTGLAGAAMALIGLLVLRHLWLRHRRRAQEADEG